MTSRCDSNPAQYERNRRFGHLVHALARAGDGAKLPSVGLCLNASKAVSCLVKLGNDILRVPSVERLYNMLHLLDVHRCSHLARHTSPELPNRTIGGRPDQLVTHCLVCRGRILVCDFDVRTLNCLQTTYVPGRVLYSVEQFPRCDLLRLRP